MVFPSRANRYNRSEDDMKSDDKGSNSKSEKVEKTEKLEKSENSKHKSLKEEKKTNIKYSRLE